jgi:hypothetical protein
MDNIHVNQQYRCIDPRNNFYGIVLKVARIENDTVVRFVNPPFEGFGIGVAAFKENWVLVG